jgi:hypothetical protein
MSSRKEATVSVTAKLILILLFAGISTIFAVDPIDVTDMIFNIGRSSEKSIEYRFAAGDTIIMNASVVEGDDISEISIVEWPYSTKFQAVGLPNIVDKRIYVTKTDVYIFRLKNTATLKSKTYQINIKRIPANSDLIMFNTSVEWDTIYDTTYVVAVETVVVKMDTVPKEIINTEKKVGSQFSGDTRSYLQIDIPKETEYWAYWIGVGQEAADGLQQMAKNLPDAAAVLGIVNPVAAYALGFIPKLCTLNKGQDITYYYIADYGNLQNFLTGNPFYMLKQGKRIITDHTIMKAPLEGRLYLGLDNSHSAMTSKTVTVNIVAVRIEPVCEYHNIEKPVVNTKVVPRLE